MNIKIKTIDWKPLEYKTPWACAFDFIASEDCVIKSMENKLVETWTVIETPNWVVLQILPRSSTFWNYWLILVNSVWIIDNDYSNDNDTIKFNYFNIWKEEVIIKKWERIWQWIFLNLIKAEFENVNNMSKEIPRWWFGTTWKK